MPNPMDTTAGINWETMSWDDPFTSKDETADDPIVWKTPVNQQKLVQEHTGSAFEQWVKSKGINLTDDTKDLLMQWYANENETKSAWEKTLQYDNTKYQRAVQDMKKAGLNPFLLLSNGSSSPNLSAANVSGGSYASRKNAEAQLGGQVAGSLLGVLGAIIGACIIAMA